MEQLRHAYPFSADSEFGRLRIGSTGTVFANVQNKHSAPGICTHSGEALLRLLRATGDARYLHALAAIVRALPQCLSRGDRTISDPLPRGILCLSRTGCVIHANHPSIVELDLPPGRVHMLSRVPGFRKGQALLCLLKTNAGELL